MTLAFFIVNLATSQISLLPRFEFLRLTHAIMVLWGEIAAKIGRWVGEIPWIPTLDVAQVNSLIVCGAVVFPPVLQVFTRGKSFIFYLRWGAYTFALLPLMFLWFSHLFRTNAPMLALLFISIAIFSPFRNLLHVYPRFGRGVFTGFTFFLVLETLYMTQFPIFSDKANEFACQVLDISDDQC